MKLLKLEILNLASLDRPDGEVIDFCHGVLAEASIFSIIGPMGSGKSTILDAICLALFNVAPRYPKVANARKQKIITYGIPDETEKNRLAPTDGRNILTRGRNRGYSKLTFMTNAGTTYRAEWSVEFKTKNYDRVHTTLYRIEQSPEGIIEIEDVWERIPDIIGLDYEQFLRTVLLAQGKFATFLTATTEERYQLLEKIVGGGEKYSLIVQEIERRKRLADEALQELKLKTQGLRENILDDIKLEVIQQEIAALTAEKEQISIKTESIRTDLKWYTDSRSLADDVIYSNTKYHFAKETKREAAAHFERLKLYDDCQNALPVATHLSQAEKSRQTSADSISELQKNHDELHAKHTEASAKQVELALLTVEAENNLANARPDILKARDLVTTINNITGNVSRLLTSWYATRNIPSKTRKGLNDFIVRLTDKQTSLSAEQSKLQQTVAADEAKLSSLIEQRDKAEKSYTSENETLEGLDAATITETKDTATRLLQAIDSLIADTTSLNDNTNTLNDYTQRISELNQAIDSAKKELTKLKVNDLESEISTLETTYLLMTGSDWQLQRSRLTDGSPCPLCGSTTHPYHYDEAFQHAENQLSQLILSKRSELTACRRQQTALNETIASSTGEISSLNRSKAIVEKNIQGLKTKILQSIESNPDFPADLDSLKLKRTEIASLSAQATLALNKYNALVTKVKQLRDKFDAAKDAVDIEKHRTDKAQKKISDNISQITSEIEVINAKIPQLRENLAAETQRLIEINAEISSIASSRREIKKQLNSLTKGESPDTIETRLTDAVTTAANKRDEQKGLIARLEAQISGIKGSIDTHKKTLEQAENTIAEDTDKLNIWIAEYNASHTKSITLQTVTDLAASTESWSDLRTLCSNITSAEISTLAARRSAFNSLKRHQKNYPQRTESELLAGLAELQNYSDENLIKKRALLDQHFKAIETLGNLNDKLSEAETTSGRWKKIWDSVGGKDATYLRQIAQCYTLRFLIDHANNEISRFTSRYRLVQVKNSLGIRIIDNDRGDDIRDTTSLSGGETFIVSLGLALGLSALSSRNVSFSNLFIDEGFGSLDSETLGYVIDSLTQLHTAQGKKVGVISHTEQMAEKIRTRIEVKKLGSSGSSRIEIYNKD